MGAGGQGLDSACGGGGGDLFPILLPSCCSDGGGGANSLLLFSWSMSLRELSDEFLEKQTGVSSIANFCFSSDDVALVAGLVRGKTAAVCCFLFLPSFVFVSSSALSPPSSSSKSRELSESLREKQHGVPSIGV